MALTKKENAKKSRLKYKSDPQYREYKKAYRKKYEKEHEEHEEKMSREYYKNHPKYRKEKIENQRIKRKRTKKSGK